MFDTRVQPLEGPLVVERRVGEGVDDVVESRVDRVDVDQIAVLGEGVALELNDTAVAVEDAIPPKTPERATPLL